MLGKQCPNRPRFSYPARFIGIQGFRFGGLGFMVSGFGLGF